MVYRKPGKNSLKKRSQRGLILGVSEEVKGFLVYLMDDKKVVATQHVKCIQTLSRAQNLTLLQPSNDSGVSTNDSFTNVAGDTGHANGIADSSPVGGELTPATPVPIERATTRRVDKRKPYQRVRDIMSSFIQALDDEDDR
jgi:hypothetical protein